MCHLFCCVLLLLLLLFHLKFMLSVFPIKMLMCVESERCLTQMRYLILFVCSFSMQCTRCRISSSKPFCWHFVVRYVCRSHSAHFDGKKLSTHNTKQNKKIVYEFKHKSSHRRTNTFHTIIFGACMCVFNMKAT